MSPSGGGQTPQQSNNPSEGNKMRRTFSVMSTNREEKFKEVEVKYDSFVNKIQNNQALQLNRGFMKRPTSGKYYSTPQVYCYFRENINATKTFAHIFE